MPAEDEVPVRPNEPDQPAADAVKVEADPYIAIQSIRHDMDQDDSDYVERRSQPS